MDMITSVQHTLRDAEHDYQTFVGNIIFQCQSLMRQLGEQRDRTDITLAERMLLSSCSSITVGTVITRKSEALERLSFQVQELHRSLHQLAATKEMPS